MRIDLTGRTALVTGSTAGIGAAVATGLAAAGDVGTVEGCAALLEAAPDVDVLVNNAGVFTPQPVFEIPFVSSESALQIPAEMVHYGTTKTAQLAVARRMAEAVPAGGVTIDSVLPGPTLTEGFLASEQASATNSALSVDGGTVRAIG